MTDGTAKGGVISKEIKRIFQRVGEIVDENQKKNRAQNLFFCGGLVVVVKGARYNHLF